MKCPHCRESFHDEQTLVFVGLGNDANGAWVLERRTCPACKRHIFSVENGDTGEVTEFAAVYSRGLRYAPKTWLVWPKGISRSPCPTEIPPPIANDYKEACLVLADSPKASAALSRRCLQNLLRRVAGIKPGDLNAEIQQVLDSNQLPSVLSEDIDAVRNIGNFAAHPIKSKSTGEIVDVEPQEAEWNLNVLESLFDFYYVLPARAKAKRDALNKKLQDANKPPMK